MFYQKLISQVLLLVYVFFIATAQADDSDIYFSGNSIVSPNVMFVLDASGSMRERVPGDPRRRDRLEVLQDSLDQVLSNTSPFLNVGLMSFSGHSTKEYVNGPTFPVSPIDDPAEPIVKSNMLPNSLKNSGYQYRGMFSVGEDNIPNPTSATQTVRDFLKDIARDLRHKRFTPIADSLYEAALYYRGDEVDWGKHIPRPDGNRRDRRAAHPASYTGQYYQRRTVTPGSCRTRQCRDDGHCPATKTNCGPITVQCNGNGCGTNCNHHVGSYPQTYCASYNRDPEAGRSCASYATRTVNYDYWTCDKIVTQCDYPYCPDIKGRWETRGTPTLTYNTPIKESCQDSFMVLLSDGGPDMRDRATSDRVRAKNKIKTLAGSGTCKSVAQHFSEDPELASYPTNALLEDGVCGAELTEFMATSDQNTSLTDDQTVGTYTIGFGITPNSSPEGYLKLLAKKGGGEYFPANDADSLVKAFNDILTEIGSTSSSFSSPAYTVNESSMFSHEDDVFMPVFNVGNFPRWSGNLKKFKLADGKLEGGKREAFLGLTPPMISAVDENGVFTEDVSDLWSTTAKDGGNVTKGGVANLLVPASRKLYSNLTGNTNVDLFAGGNHINSSNVVSADLLAAADPNYGDASYASKLIKFIQGYESDGTTARHHMGDIMHSKPEVVSYDNSTRTKRFVFVSTNEGYLHAFDSNTGEEKFAFMPKDLLKNIDSQYKNNEPRTHTYGLDGEITVWKHDQNKDGKIKKADGDFVHLFFGMRRGGRNVYALDVTEIDRPKLLWKITGGVGDFAQLGQTWSKPSLVKLHSPVEADAGKLIDVLVFGGGYDPALDEEDVTVRTADTMGMGVYIVNAKTGAHIWSNQTSLTHSVPAEIRVLDMDKNGSIDRLYFGDTGGNIWRVDLDIDIRDGYAESPPTLYNISEATTTKLADLGGSGADKRKFFHEPDVSLVKESGKHRLLISIGSGYRSRPLNQTINDRFYVLLDDDVNSLPSSAFPTIDAELLDGATDLSGKSIVTRQREEQALGNTVKGWFYILPTLGEKVLAGSRTFLGKVMFTTFTSGGSSADPCVTPPSSGRAYILNILTGEAVLDLNRDGVVDSTDKFIVAGTNEILGTPQIVFHEPKSSGGGACTENDCRHYVDIRVGKKLTPIGDRDNSDDSKPISSLDLGKILPRSYWLDHNAAQ